MSFKLTNTFHNAKVAIQTISNSPSQPKLARLNLTDNLSKIRKQLEIDNIINDTLSFSRKCPIINNNNDESHGFAEIGLENEKDFLLNEIIDENEESYNTLYLIKSSDTSNDRLLQESTSIILSPPNTAEVEVKQMIQQLKLNHGSFLDGYNIRPSKQAIFVEDGELNLSLCNEQPIVYTNINQSSDLCINFPIAEITYKADFLESFLKCMHHDEKLHEFYGHFYARKISVGGKLFLKELSSATQVQIDILKFYLFHAYNLAKYSTEIQFNNLFALDLLPKIETLDREKLNTHEKLANWMNNLYQKNMVDKISYDNLIPTPQLKINVPSGDNFKNLTEKQPGVINFKEKLSLEEWVGNASCDNLVRWVKDFQLLQCLIINNYYEVEISKKVVANFVKIPTVESSNKSYLEIIRPKSNVEEFLILNNIFTVKDINSFPFINGIIKSDDQSYLDNKFLVKFEQFEILINRDHIKPSEEFERAVKNALKCIKPFKALRDVFDEYGHLFPQKIILGRCFKRNIPNTSLDTSNKIDLKPPTFKSLKPYLDNDNISYLLTRKGDIIEENELSDLIQNLNNDLEIIEFDDIISLYKILEIDQQREIDNIFEDNKIIMTGITDLKDLNNNNAVHYKRINVGSSLEDENYEVFGSIVTKNSLKSQYFTVTFGLYDINGFSAMINKLMVTNFDIKEYYILWMIMGNPSKLSVFSPKNRDIKVKYFKKSITLQPNQLNYHIETPFSLSQNDIISFNGNFTNFEHKNNIKLIKWSYSSIDIEIIKSTFNEANEANETNEDNLIISDDDTDYSDFDYSDDHLDLNICILSSDYKYLKVDNRKVEYPLNLIGDILTENVLQEKEKEKVKKVEVVTSVINRAMERLAVEEFEEKIPSPTRQGLISRGSKVVLRANYVKISKYGYDIISSSRRRLDKKIRQRVFSEMRKQNKFGKCLPVYDGNDLIYCSTKLPLKNENGSEKYNMTLPPEDEGSTKIVTFIITIKFKKEFSLQYLKDFITSKQRWDGNVQTCMYALNTYINYKVHENFLVVGRGIYPPSDQRIMLSGGAELKKGFCQSLRAGWDNLTINVDLCSNMFCPPGNVVEVVADILRYGKNELRRGIDDRTRRLLVKTLKGIKFRVTHRGNNKKSKYTIEGLTKDSANKITFKDDENRDVTITQFFATKYQRKLEFGNLPCIVVSKSSKNCFPLELCEILPDQHFKGDISDEGRADMIKHTCVRPGDRFRTIEGSFRNVFKYDQDEYLKSINMGVSTNTMMTVEGIVLPPVSMSFQGQAAQKIDGGRWNFVNHKIQDPKKLTNWSVLILSNDSPDSVGIFMRTLRETLNKKGMNVVNNPLAMNFNPQGNIQQGLVQAIQKAIIDKNEPPQLIMIVMRERSRLYSDIKRISETILGVHTQCLLSKHLRRQKGLEHLCVNLGLKINAKLGGKNCSLTAGQIEFVSSVPTMVFGADVYHSGVYERYYPSIAAVCASMDPTATIYSGRYSMNVKPRNETIERLEEMVIDLLKTFRAKNGRLPQRIIFYRDGVSEGQFRKVKEEEVAAMQSAFKGGYGDKPPKLTFIIVQKRHHTRFMPVSKRDGDRLGNCRPGTVVDTEIVVKQEFDFFLQSHASIQGTGRPAHYRVLFDENKFKADDIVSLTNKLCYLNARCTSATSVVTPAYYAHLIANRARHYTVWDGDTSSEGNASCAKVKPAMSNNMFFL